jgi:hypothetical protein
MYFLQNTDFICVSLIITVVKYSLFSGETGFKKSLNPESPEVIGGFTECFKTYHNSFVLGFFKFTIHVHNLMLS